MEGEANINQTQTPDAAPQSVTVDVGPPPAYEGECSSVTVTSSAPQAFSPPGYDVATKLPSYDEAEKSKAAEAGFTVPDQPVCPDRAAREERRNRQGFFFWSGPGLFLGENRREPVDPSTISHAQLQQQVLGSELEFLCCFLVALLFNWIGLFAALCCLTVTIAGRAGAISGFGLSVVKWAFLVMHQSYITRATLGLDTTSDSPFTFDNSGYQGTTDMISTIRDNKWFTVSCWLIVGLGFLCFLQGIVHYVRAKRCSRDYNWLRQRYHGQPF